MLQTQVTNPKLRRSMQSFSKGVYDVGTKSFSPPSEDVQDKDD